MKFTNYPSMTPTGRTREGRPVFKLDEYFVFYLTYGDSSRYIKVPKNFETDFASLPWFARCMFSPLDPRWINAALIHDHLYKKGVININGLSINSSRKLADLIFFTAMVCNHKNPTPKWIANLFYFAVRLFGQKNYLTR